MSRKYYDKVLAGSGTSSVKVKSAFGAKILAKYGWKEGQGLGSSMNGVEECVQVERREERVGIGAEKKSESEWDNWWSGAYDSVASKIAVKVNSKKSSVVTSSSEEEQEVPKKKKKEKKQKVEEDEEPMHKKRRVKRHVRDE
jgi:tuftelin-interacting protein 11